MPNYKEWLEHLKQSWEGKDYVLLATMFPEKLTYFESPFLSPFTARQQVIDEWKKGLKEQRKIHFDWDILHEDKNDCFAHWNVSFIRDNATVVLDGVFHFRLDPEKRCPYFKMWWVTK